MTAKNVVIFVADGLRNGSVNATDTPTLYSIRQQGVSFTNSNSLFPTFTTPNASAIATGHLLGDTGDFSNTIYSGFPTPNAAGSVTPFIENNAILGDIDEKFPGLNGFLDEESLLAYARAQGFDTAAVGKLGPVAIQDVTQVNRTNSTTIATPSTVIIDDRTGAAANAATGSPAGVPIPTAIQQRMTNAGLALVTPSRAVNGNASSGNNTTPGTTAANTVQQQYFADVTTEAILPQFQADGKQFALVYWSRDPDGSQHNQGDSLNSLTPGINGPTSKLGVTNADNNLKQLLDYLKATNDPNSPGKKLIDTTDVFITSDHGFSTISKQAIDSKGTPTTSYAAQQTYSDVNKGFLPVGFVAIDLAHDLGLTLYDPDKAAVPYSNGNVTYTVVDATKGQHPLSGDGVIGGSGQVVNNVLDPNTQVVVAANGGSDLIYLPTPTPGDTTLITKIVNLLSQKDYVSGIFVDDRTYGSIAGALPMSSIGLIGSAQTPVPAIIINFKTFSTNSNNPNDPQAQVEIADTTLQQGQGMHGSFGRGDTFNNMEAIGPDIKTGYVDNAPVSNADVTPTLASVLGFNIPSTGTLKGRAITEALVGGADVSYTQGQTTSAPSASGQSTILDYQTVGNTPYFTTAGFSGRTVGLPVLSTSLGGNTQTLLQSSINSTTGKVDLIFNLTQTKHQNLNEIGVFEVDDDKGTINGIAAGNTQAYIQAALKRSQILFAALPTDDVLQVTKQSTTRQLSFDQSAHLAFYLVSNDTSNKVLSDLSSGKAPSSTAPVFFNFASANSDKVEHLKVNNSTSTSGLTLNWNDQVGGGSTFTGAVVSVQAQNTANTPSVDAGSLNLLLDLTKVSSPISTTCTVNSEAAYNDFVGYYKVVDNNGGVTSSNGTGTIHPGEAGYAQAAIQQAVPNFGLSNGVLSNTSTVRNTNSATQNLLAGSLLAPFLITNGDNQSFLAKNASNATTDATSGKTPLAYFAYANANPDGQDHIRGIGGNRLTVEDGFKGGDHDFNDLVFQLNPSQTLTTAAVTI